MLAPNKKEPKLPPTNDQDQVSPGPEPALHPSGTTTARSTVPSRGKGVGREQKKKKEGGKVTVVIRRAAGLTSKQHRAMALALTAILAGGPEWERESACRWMEGWGGEGCVAGATDRTAPKFG